MSSDYQNQQYGHGQYVDQIQAPATREGTDLTTGSAMSPTDSRSAASNTADRDPHHHNPQDTQR